MKYSTTLLSLLAASLAFTVQADDEYQYIPTPNADQIADLRDDDSDGVINARDKCPETATGSEINNYGCGETVHAASEFDLKILFENDSDSVSPAYMSEIQRLADFLSRYSTTSIELQGYASKVGNSSYNLDLSERRANNVMASLVSAGVSADKVKIVGFGDTVLIDESDTELAHSLNRRVVATVVGYTSEILKEWTIFSRKKD
ncbi:OmpA family protein [Vibrio sp. TH_r3]|uniref:OmpA family protein n=1 Tax=Vibrio sp. TH_r3 TaxID=3082084 RepID=UPI0029535DA1|nr:OmpA family protein [Vibrio sp. TH_r3]MDV7104398.1 OmpA family protein [Vibrio sp. TH_r3]